MKKKQKLFLGFAIIVMAIFAMAGCILSENVDDAFPNGFIGTWKRESSSYTSTLTFTSTDLKASNQYNIQWDFQSVSGDAYKIKSSLSGTTATITIKLVNGKLQISGDSGSGENNWNGTWIKQ